MKKIILLITVLTTSIIAFAQDYSSSDLQAQIDAIERQRNLAAADEAFSFFGWAIVLVILLFIIRYMLKSLFDISYNIRLKEAQLFVSMKQAMNKEMTESEVEELLKDVMRQKKSLRDLKLINKYFK